jgi:5-methylcytosine-specific restriction protein A
MANLRTLRPLVRPFHAGALKPQGKKKAAPYYDAQWRKLRDAHVAQYGAVCADPQHDPSRPRTGKIYVDHIVELQDGGELLDPSNLMCRCASCHTKKTIASRVERLRS